MDLIHQIESLRHDIENSLETDVIKISVRLIQMKDQAIQLLKSNTEGNDLKQYLVTYRKVLEAPHPLLDDEIITASEIIEVSGAIEINNLFKNIIDVKRIF